MDPKPNETWTPLKILQWAVPYLAQKGLPNPRLDAEVLIAHALGVPRLQVYLQYDRPLDKEELARIRGLFQRRAQHEPIQYITGTREFHGLVFSVAPGVLIPRPETELLVEKAVEYLKGIPEGERTVLDLGTGSGCIALSIAHRLPCEVWATDLSPRALSIAQENAQALGVHGLNWRQGDWFEALRAGDPERFQLILSNPPYIPLEDKDSLAKEVRDFEPSEALFAGNKGLAAYEAIQRGLFPRLARTGMALLELEANAYDKIKGVFEGPWSLDFYRDLAGHPRVLSLKPR